MRSVENYQSLHGYPRGRALSPRFSYPEDIDPSTAIPPEPPITDYDGWWDASDVASLGVTAGVVKQWDDQGDGAHHLGEGVAGTGPSWGARRLAGSQSGPYVIDFDGSNDRLDTAVFSLPGQQFSFFAVIEPDNVAPAALQAIMAITGSNGPQIGVGTTGLLTYLREGTAADAEHDKPLVAGQPNVIGVVVGTEDGANDTSVDFYVDKTFDRDVKLDNAGTSSGTFRLGTRSNQTQFFDGAIAEVIIYLRILELWESWATMSYLAHKWDL